MGNNNSQSDNKSHDKEQDIDDRTKQDLQIEETAKQLQKSITVTKSKRVLIVYLQHRFGQTQSQWYHWYHHINDPIFNRDLQQYKKLGFQCHFNQIYLDCYKQNTKFSMKEFLGYQWTTLAVVSLANCHIDDQAWREFVVNHHIFINLKMAYFQGNQITTVINGDLQKFTNLTVIYFCHQKYSQLGWQQNPLNEYSLKYLKKLSFKYSSQNNNKKVFYLPERTPK